MKKTPFKDIWRFKERVTDGGDVYEAGYYFVDERSMLDGPYSTLAKARKAQQELLDYLHKSKPEEK